MKECRRHLGGWLLRENQMNFWNIKSISVTAVAAALATSAIAVPLDAKITIDRALGNSTLTIKYSGASANLAELRLNGESLGTRTLASDKSAGETNFTLNPADLKDGENTVEVRLFDRTGRTVGVQKQIILAEQSSGSAVFMAKPKLGQTVLGIVEVQIGFNASLKNTYVSYFVDGQFKGMTNYPPYSLNWDTSKETNGWHEVEAWAVDESSNTYKTRKVRLFVNNPSGRTDRTGVEEATPVANGVSGSTFVVAPSGMKSVKLGRPTVAGAMTAGVTPKTTMAAAKSGASAKPTAVPKAVVAGPKLMMPTGTRVAAAKPLVKPAVKTVVAKATKQIVNLGAVKTATVAGSTASVNAAVGAMRTAATLAISKGTRLPNVGTFAVALNSKFVNFDVAPRVENGIPMTPFRHLFEAAGGKVKWENLTKSVTASADGSQIMILIGDPNAKVNELSIKMEAIPYLERGRTIIPVSFLRDALKVEVEYDKATNHVLITTKKN